MPTLNGTKLPDTMSTRALAAAIGIARQTLMAYEKNGYVFRNEGDKKWNVREVLDHRKRIGADDRMRGQKGSAVTKGKAPVSKPEKSGSAEQRYSVSRAEKEHWNAEKARFQAEVMAANLIPRDDAEFALTQIGNTTVTSLRNLIPKLRPHMSDAGKDILQKEIDATLSEIARALAEIIEPRSEDDDAA